MLHSFVGDHRRHPALHRVRRNPTSGLSARWVEFFVVDLDRVQQKKPVSSSIFTIKVLAYVRELQRSKRIVLLGRLTQQKTGPGVKYGYNF